MALPHTDPTDPTDLTDLTDFFVGGKSYGGSPLLCFLGLTRISRISRIFCGICGLELIFWGEMVGK